MSKRGVLTKAGAVAAIQKAGLSLSGDYHALSPTAVDKVLFIAKLYGYTKPKNASGSTGRMFWLFMQRVARR